MEARWLGAAILVSAAHCVAAAAGPISIPFEERNGMPFFHVAVNGQSVPILFDLGDSSTLRLNRSVLARIGAERTGRGGKILQIQGGPVESPEYLLQSIELGPVKFGPTTVRMETHDPSYAPDQIGQAGFLGTGLLKPYIVRIDYSQKRLQLLSVHDLSGHVGHQCEGISAAFEPEWEGEAVTRVTMDVGDVVLWWDTGAMTALSRQYLERAHPAVKGDQLSSKRFLIGGHELGPRSVEIWDANLPRGFQGFIGRDFLHDYVVCIDYPSKRVVIER